MLNARQPSSEGNRCGKVRWTLSARSPGRLELVAWLELVVNTVIIYVQNLSNDEFISASRWKIKIKNRPPWMAVENLLAVLLYPPKHFPKWGKHPRTSGVTGK